MKKSVWEVMAANKGHHFAQEVVAAYFKVSLPLIIFKIKVS